jgi:hypothetical protein
MKRGDDLLSGLATLRGTVVGTNKYQAIQQFAMIVVYGYKNHSAIFEQF